ncbi:MAG: hypothetical protein ACR2RE_24390, partial [Geminicoccaceae bacterium]
RNLDLILRSDPLEDVRQARSIFAFLTRPELLPPQHANAEAIQLLCILATVHLLALYVRFASLVAIAKWPKRKRKQYKLDDIDIDVEALNSAGATVRAALEQVQVLHDRIDGKEEPLEGIRIVRERKEEEAAD